MNSRRAAVRRVYFQGDGTPAMIGPEGERLKVLHVLAPAREGGLERVVQMLASGQGARAHVAAVVTPGESPHPFVVDLRARHVAVTEVVCAGRAYFREYRALAKLLRDIRPDVVHTHGYRADIMAGIAARRAGVPVVSTVHGFLGGRARVQINERLQSYALRHAGAVVAVSRPIVDRLRNTGVHPNRIHVVPNAYAPAAPIAGRDEARHRLGIDPSALVAGWVGRLSDEKGPDVMLDALAATSLPWRLSIIGDGRTREQLVAQVASLGIADRVTWHGTVAHAGALLNAFDAFVLSSRTEGTPIALLEAMAAGVPIVATQVGGVPDVVSETEAIIVPSERPAAIATALAAIKDDPVSASLRGAASQRRIEQEFATGPWVNAIDMVYLATKG